MLYEGKNIKITRQAIRDYKRKRKVETFGMMIKRKVERNKALESNNKKEK